MARIEPFIVNLWDNIPVPERFACIRMANGTVVPSLTVPVALVTADFVANEPSYPETRQTAWERGYDVFKFTAVIDELEIEFYNVDKQWMFDLYQALLDGTVSVEDDYGPPLNFKSSPVPLEP